MSKCCFAPTKKVKLSMSLALALVLGYVALLFCQVTAFDRLVGSLNLASLQGFDTFVSFHKIGFLEREVVLEVGTPTSSKMLTMRGRLETGASPILLFTSEGMAYEENSLFKKAKPKLEVAFDVAMHPQSIHLQWMEAVEKDERIGSGQLNAAFKFEDTTLSSLQLTGEIGDIKIRLPELGLLVEAGEKTLSYVYQNSPRSLDFQYKSRRDQVTAEDQPPLSLGRNQYDITIRPEQEQNNLKIIWQAEGVLFADLPPIKVDFVGSLATPTDVWMPCLFSQLVFSSRQPLFPGICPKDINLNPFEELGRLSAKGRLDRLTMDWKTGTVDMSGAFVSHETLSGHLDIEARLKSAIRGLHSESHITMNREVADLLKDYVSMEVAEKDEKNIYKTHLTFAMDEHGHMKVSANGKEIERWSSSEWDSSDNLESYDILVTIEDLPKNQAQAEVTILEPLRSHICNMPEVKHCSGSHQKPRGYELRITLNRDVDHEEIRRRIMKFVDVLIENQSIFAEKTG